MKNRTIRRVCTGGTPVGGNPDGHADMHQVGNGTFQVKFYPVRSSFFRSHGDKEGLVDAQIQCITALNYYKNYSLEELRWDDYNIRAFRAVPSTATKELQSRTVQTRPVINLSGPGEDSSDRELFMKNEISRMERKDSWPFLDRAVPLLGSIFPSPMHRSLSPTGSNHKSSPSDASNLSSHVDINGLVRAPSSQTSLHPFRSTIGPVQSSAAEPVQTTSSCGLSQAFEHNTIQSTTCDRPTSDPPQNALVQNSGTALNPSLGLLPSSSLNLPILKSVDVFTDHSTNGKLDFPTKEVLLWPARPAQSPPETGSTQCPIPQNRNLELGVSQHGQLLGARPGSETTALKTVYSDDHNGCTKTSSQGADMEAVSHALGQGVSRLTDLQGSICDLLSQSATGETLCWHIVFELRSSQDFKFYEQMPGDILCIAVENRELMTKQLMNLFRKTADGRNVQMCHVVMETLSQEFQFIGRLKLLMLKKLLEVRNSDSTKSESCIPQPSSRGKVPNPDCADSGTLIRRRSENKFFAEEEGKGSDIEIRDSSFDMHVRVLLNNKDDMLIFSEPGKLFRFAVQPGSQFAEKWTEEGNGMVSVYENAAAKHAKIVVGHWTAKRSHSVILIRPSMKTRFLFSEDGYSAKFMGLDASKARKMMRYFQVRFRDLEGATKFRNIFEGLPFLNTSQEVPGLVCCLDFKFNSVSIHDEFPSKKSDETAVGASADLPNGITKTHCDSALCVCSDDGRLDYRGISSCEYERLDCGEICVHRDEGWRYTRNGDDLVVKSLTDLNLAVTELRRSSLPADETRNFEDNFSRNSVIQIPGIDNRFSPEMSEDEKRNKVTPDDGGVLRCCEFVDQPDCAAVRPPEFVSTEIAHSHDSVVNCCHDNGNVLLHGNKPTLYPGREDDLSESDDKVAHHEDCLSPTHREDMVEGGYGKGIEGHRGAGFVSPCDDVRGLSFACGADGYENRLARIEAVGTEDGECKADVGDVCEKEGIDMRNKEIENCSNEEGENDEDGRCEDGKCVIEADEEDRCEESKGMIGADEEDRCEENSDVIEDDEEGRCEESKGVIEADEEDRCEESKGMIGADEEDRCEENNDVIEDDEEGRCEESKGMIGADEEDRCEENNDVIEDDEEGRCEESKGMIGADEEERCGESKGMIGADEEDRCEENNDVIEDYEEGRCEESKGVIEADEEDRCEESKGMIGADEEDRCEENNNVIEDNEEGRCEESKGVIETDKEVIEADEEVTETDEEVTEADEEVIEADKEMIEADEEVIEADKEVIEANEEGSCEENRSVIEGDGRDRCEERSRSVIKGDEKDRCEESNGVIEADGENRCEERKGVIKVDGENRCEERKDVIEVDGEKSCEERKGVIEADGEGRCEEAMGVILADEEDRCEESKGMIEDQLCKADGVSNSEEIKDVFVGNDEDRCEERLNILLTTEVPLESPELTFLYLFGGEETQALLTERNGLYKDCQGEADSTFDKNTFQENSGRTEIELFLEEIEGVVLDGKILAPDNVQKSAIKLSAEMVKGSELRPYNNLEVSNEILTIKVFEKVGEDREFEDVMRDSIDRISEDIEQADVGCKCEDTKQGEICRNFEDIKKDEIGQEFEDIKQGDIGGKFEVIKQGDICRNFADTREDDVGGKFNDIKQGDTGFKFEDIKQGDIYTNFADIKEDEIVEDIKHVDIGGKFEDVKQSDICRNFEDIKKVDIGGEFYDVKQDEIDRTVGGIEPCGRDGRLEDFFEVGIRQRVTMN